MNILILATHLNPGGVSRYVLNLAKGLVKQGHTVFVASSGGSWVPELVKVGIVHKYIPIKTKAIFSFKILFSCFVLKRLIRKTKIDLIHANTRATQSLGALIQKRYQVPYICAFHGFYKPGLFRKLFSFSGVLSIAVSKKVKHHLVDDLGISEKKIRVVYNGIDAEEFSPKVINRKQYGFGSGDYLIGILGRISQEKGHFLALEAMKKLLPRHKDAYLLVSGEGKLKDELKEAIEASELNRNVKFIQTTSEEFLDLVDLLIAPSIKEGFGYSVVEAFAKKVPVVGYNTGGISEIIRNGENGILFYDYKPFALASAIEEVISGKELRERIVEQAYRDVFNFSLQRMVSETVKVYQEAGQ
ncbi:MAG: glycosyltransferase family 4 protein [Candidatus Omnitrophica bacterium]|nr:glycosyltransferase family 4 protein [Candidatus Omnitrophota bacterium]